MLGAAEAVTRPPGDVHLIARVSRDSIATTAEYTRSSVHESA
jgi:hypothetical protein